MSQVLFVRICCRLRFVDWGLSHRERQTARAVACLAFSNSAGSTSHLRGASFAYLYQIADFLGSGFTDRAGICEGQTIFTYCM